MFEDFLKPKPKNSVRNSKDMAFSTVANINQRNEENSFSVSEHLEKDQAPVLKSILEKLNGMEHRQTRENQ